ncbi:MAG: methyltransferase domain-containing protein [Deltaproteobacteria bacterium]|jgi:phospholipid N-methyltransferase|nr:methyltransferase domain-containing protein [Deltaproteobacteria bacterium]
MLETSKFNARGTRRVRSYVGGLLGAGAFLFEFMKRPATVGSVCPSGAALTRRLLGGISKEDDGLVVDLGAGPGSVSARMLRSGIAKERIIAIEAISDFRGLFAARCPGVRFVVADARELKKVLDREAPGRKISAIVSSLPFRVLGTRLSANILRETHMVLRERGGVLIQYSYALWLKYPLRDNGFVPLSASVVWVNMPPARVELYKP